MHWLAVGIAAVVVIAGLVVSLRRLAREPVPRRIILAALRGLALLALLGAIWNPAVISRQPAPVLPETPVLVDTSASMGLPVDRDGPSRLDAARGSLQAVLERPASTVGSSWRACGFSDTVLPLASLESALPAGARTDLGGAITFLAAQSPGASAIIATDGADTESARVEVLITAARAADLTLNFLAVGRPAPIRDVAVTSAQAPRQVRQGASFDLVGAVRSQGLGSGSIELRLARDGRAVMSRNIPAGRPRTVRFRLKAGEPGRYRYELRASPAEGEISLANNSRAALVTVLPDRTRVLLIAGAPHPEYAALKRLLLSDRDLNVTCLVRKAATEEFWRDDSGYRKSSLSAALSPRPDAVILQDVPGVVLGSVAPRLAELVNSGAGIAVLAGPLSAASRAPSLAPLLPVAPGNSYLDEVFDAALQPGAEALGLGAGDTLDLPALRGRNSLGSPRKGARVALAAGGFPLLVLGSAGQGRAAVLGTNATHRWVLSAASSDAGEKAFGRLWSGLVDWLTEVRDDRPVVAEFDRDAYPPGEPARLLVQVSDAAGLPVDGAQVTARTLLAGEKRPVTCEPDPQVPGRYQAYIAGHAAGEMSVTATASLSGRNLGSDTASARFIPADLELMVSRPDRRLLEALARATGGVVAAPGQEDMLARAAQPRPRTVLRETHRTPLRQFWMLWLLVAVLGLDWSLRRAWGV